MKNTALYEQLLGLKSPWSVKSVDVSLTEQRVVVEVVLKPGQLWVDPADHTKRAHINGFRSRQWRHLDTCQFETIIKARVPQLKYNNGTVEELTVPWAERISRVTLLMEGFVIKLLAESAPPQKGYVSLPVCLGVRQTAIMVSAVERGMLRRSDDSIPYLGIDEKSSERGQPYISVLTDIERSSVLDVVPERKLGTLPKSCCKHLAPLNARRSCAAAMDMWPAFMSATRECLPQADIVHDRFHVAKYLGKAVDTVRKQEYSSLSKVGTSPLTKSKYAWLKNYADGRSSEAVAFRALNQLNLKTSRAWRIKETFTQFWSYYYRGAAKRFFDAWSNNAMRSRLMRQLAIPLSNQKTVAKWLVMEPIKKVVKMLRRHVQGLLSYSRHRITNASTEGFNSAIQLIEANARGIRNFNNYRARILFQCGKLDMRLG